MNLNIIYQVELCRIKDYLISEGSLFNWPEQIFSLFTHRITPDRLELNKHVLPLKDVRFSNGANKLENCHVNLLASIVERMNSTKNASNTGRVINSLNPPPHTSDLETAKVAETKASPTTNLSVLHAAAVYECVRNNDLDVVAKGVSVASQFCLLSSSDEGSGGALESFFHDRLDFFSGEALERIIEADPSVVLALLDESGRDCHIGGN